MLRLPPKIGFPRKGRAAYRHLKLRPPEARPQKRMGNGSWRKRTKRKKREEERFLVPSAQEPKTKGKLPRRSPAARSGDAIRESAKDQESYADILKAMKVKVNPQNAGAEVLFIRRTRREEILLVLKKGVTSRPSKMRSTRRSERRPRGPVQAVRTFWWCADYGGPFNRGGRPELAQAR